MGAAPDVAFIAKPGAAASRREPRPLPTLVLTHDVIGK